ncbi:MAG: S9 family peptidase [Chitinophagaceae bacterium]|nr:S9 family peptidase [Chitinophagaceae bacterium]
MEDNGQGLRLFSVDDIIALPSVSAVAISPEGNSIVCVVTRSINNVYRDDITLIDLDTGMQKIIAEGSSPQWSPDEKNIAYTGDNNGTAALYVYTLENESVVQLVNIYPSDYFIDHYASAGFCWSPDGQSIAYISTRPLPEDDDSATVMVITDLLYKTKGGRGRYKYAGKEKMNIWLVSVNDRKSSCLFESEYDEHSISFSPDGKKICFISNRTGAPDRNQWSDVYALDVPTGIVQQISSEKGSAFQPSWSPDGRYIAYLGIKSEISTNDSIAEDTQLYIVSSSGSDATCLTALADRRVEQLSWNNAATHIYFTAGNHGNTIVYRVQVSSGQIEEVIVVKGKVAEYSVSKDEQKIAFICTDSRHRGEIFIYDTAQQSKMQVTHFSDAILKGCSLQSAETFWYTSFDNREVQGWIIKPAQFDETKKYPLILVIHGGPHNMFGDEFEDRMQLLSANGYGVLFINPRGSSGYGQAFSKGAMSAWGEGDYEDLMKGVDVAVEQHSWIDASRLGVTGQSYGGYMTNRIITKTQRFKAAVADGSICNLISFSGTSLYHSLMESEFQAAVYDSYEALWNCSPLKDVKKVSTPVLFLHGETDNEVPVSQAEEMYVALKKQGVKTSLIVYAGEGHGWRPDLKPHNRIDVLQRIIGWFDLHIK